MTDLAPAWSWDESLQSVGPRVRRFLQAQAEYRPGRTFAEGVEDVFALGPGELTRLSATYLASPQRTDGLLDDCRFLTRRLASARNVADEEYLGEVRGQVDWLRTMRRRGETGDPTVFICKTTKRHYDTPTARLLRRVLTRLESFAVLAALDDRGPLGQHLHACSREAGRLLANSKFRGKHSVVLREPILESLAGRSARHQRLVEFDRLCNAVLDDQHPDLLWSVILAELLLPRPDVLFELEVGFRVVDALIERGFVSVGETVLIDGGPVPLATLDSPTHGQAKVWWQRSLREIVGTPVSSFKRDTEVVAGMRPAALLPDVVLVLDEGKRVFLLEVKHTIKAGPADERRGLVEVMAYLFDTPEVFGSASSPHAAVVAWNATGSPRRCSDSTWPRVLIGDQKEVGEIVDAVLTG